MDATARQGDKAPSDDNTSSLTQNSQKQLIFPERTRENIHILEVCKTADKLTDKAEPDFLWRQIPASEKCELCGQFAVEYEIANVKGHQMLRRCQSCFDRMRHAFSNSVWKNVGGLDCGRQNQSQNDDSQVKVRLDG